MGTPADKLSYLLDTKAAIREAIEGKGQTISDEDTFRSYAEAIRKISTGSTPVVEQVIPSIVSQNLQIPTSKKVSSLYGFYAILYNATYTVVFVYDPVASKAVEIKAMSADKVFEYKWFPVSYGYSSGITVSVGSAPSYDSFWLDTTTAYASISYIPA